MTRHIHLLRALSLGLATLLIACGPGDVVGRTAAGEPLATSTPLATSGPKVATEAEPNAATVTPSPEPTTSPTPTQEAEPTGTPSAEPMTQAATTPPPVPTAAPEAAGLPVRLQIDTRTVKVDAAVEEVGHTDKGTMGVPKAWENVAWFKLGTRPGQPGNAVIAGHLDSKTGPAVFWRLGELKPGEVVSVVNDQGETTRFEVKKTAVYETEEAPLQEVFGPSDAARLNLITCDGAFDQETRTYDRRLVVYTEKIDG